MGDPIKTRKYKVDSCGVCGHVFVEQADHLECPRCGMKYDLIEGKGDNTDVMVEPYNCKHRHRMFVQGARDSNGSHEHVTVCADCGEIKIWGRTVDEGGHFNVRIMLSSDDLVTAVSRWARLLKNSSKKRGENHS